MKLIKEAIAGTLESSDLLEGFLREVAIAKGFGFDGKSLIHPKQIELLHSAYEPTPEEVNHAKLWLRRRRKRAARVLGWCRWTARWSTRP
jgi:citrate lyase beta subunit